MGETFRASMGWLHTWSGVVLGGLLFAVFWMGTLSVFDREIDRWMMPETRLSLPVEPVSLDRIIDRIMEVTPENARRLDLKLPSGREPTLWLRHQTAEGKRVVRHLDPATGALLADQGTLAGTRFIFPFHFNLHLRWMNIGIWLVGLAGMAMLALLVSGAVIHRKILADFFTFRPGKKLPRSSLDLHNLTGILALPFHCVITLSGLIIFSMTYFPTIKSTVYEGDPSAFSREAFGTFHREAANVSGPLASLDAMAAEAKQLWNGEKPSLLRVWHPGDANALIEIYRNRETTIDLNIDTVYFDAGTGEVLHERSAQPVVHAQRFIAGLHSILFEHWPLRWLYFVLGLSGCVMIATGYIYWLETRRKRHAALDLPGLRIVEGLTVGSVSGIIIATLAFFVANRILPLGASFAGQDRAALEIWAFYLVWLATFAHAWVWPRRAWREQCRAIAGLAVLAVVLNAATTGDHLVRALAHRHLWAVAGMDLLLLAGAAIALLTALRLARRRSAAGPAQDTLKAAE